MAKLVVEEFGTHGVNVDKNPLELDDNELMKGQNALSVVEVGRASLRKRPGLIAFNTSLTAGSVLGGADLPIQNQSNLGAHYIYLGRGPT